MNMTPTIEESQKDPWNELNSSKNDEESVGFDDNFCDKLPDSAEYLDRLETKLSKIKTKRRYSGNIKEEVLSRYLEEEEGAEYLETFDITPSLIVSKIQPQQPLNTLETQPLIVPLETKEDSQDS